MVQEQRETEVSSQEMLKTERYLWIARAFSAVAILSIVANMLLFSAIGSLYPLTRVQHFFLRSLDKKQQVVQVVPPETSEYDVKMMLKSYIREYILDIYTITEDYETLEQLWSLDGRISLRTSADIFGELRKKKYGEIEDKIKKEHYTSEVQIKDVKDLDAEGIYWEVELQLKRRTDSTVEPEILDFKERLTVVLDPTFSGDASKGVTWEQRMRNPLGFKVVAYGSMIDNQK